MAQMVHEDKIVIKGLVFITIKVLGQGVFIRFGSKVKV